MSSTIDITAAERHALYIRDRHTCLWCGCKVVPGASTHCEDAATLDHIITRHAGGSDALSNLMTACASCNTRRQSTPTKQWLADLASVGVDVAAIEREHANRKRRVIDLDKGRAQAARVSAVLRAAALVAREMLIEGV